MNRYDLTGEYGIGYTTKGQKFYFDLEDYDLIADYQWYIDNSGYVRTNIKKGNDRGYLFMHSLITNTVNSKMIADHIRGRDSTNDNRKSNLRIVNKSQNNINQKIRKDNKTNVKGVNKKVDIVKGKEYIYWQSRIQINGIRYDLGRFKNFEDAVKARKEAEEKYHGKYTYEKSQRIGAEDDDT